MSPSEAPLSVGDRVHVAVSTGPDVGLVGTIDKIEGTPAADGAIYADVWWERADGSRFMNGRRLSVLRRVEAKMRGWSDIDVKGRYVAGQRMRVVDVQVRNEDSCVFARDRSPGGLDRRMDVRLKVDDGEWIPSERWPVGVRPGQIVAVQYFFDEGAERELGPFEVPRIFYELGGP